MAWIYSLEIPWDKIKPATTVLACLPAYPGMPPKAGILVRADRAADGCLQLAAICVVVRHRRRRPCFAGVSPWSPPPGRRPPSRSRGYGSRRHIPIFDGMRLSVRPLPSVPIRPSTSVRCPSWPLFVIAVITVIIVIIFYCHRHPRHGHRKPLGSLIVVPGGCGSGRGGLDGCRPSIRIGTWDEPASRLLCCASFVVARRPGDTSSTPFPEQRPVYPALERIDTKFRASEDHPLYGLYKSTFSVGDLLRAVCWYGAGGHLVYFVQMQMQHTTR